MSKDFVGLNWLRGAAADCRDDGAPWTASWCFNQTADNMERLIEDNKALALRLDDLQKNYELCRSGEAWAQEEYMTLKEERNALASRLDVCRKCLLNIAEDPNDPHGIHEYAMRVYHETGAVVEIGRKNSDGPG